MITDKGYHKQLKNIIQMKKEKNITLFNYFSCCKYLIDFVGFAVFFLFLLLH